MAEVTNELIYEVLRSIQDRLTNIENRLSAVATPNTHRQGGVHTFRMRTVLEEPENAVKEVFTGPAWMRLVTGFPTFNPGPTQARSASRRLADVRR